MSAQDDADREWDAFLASTPHGYHEQTSLYATLRNEYGLHSARTVVRDSENSIIGGVQVLFQKTPIGRLGLVLRGPIAKNDDPETLQRVVTSLNKLAKNNRLSSIRVETFSTQRQTRKALAEEGYLSSSAWNRDAPCAFIELQMDDAAMLLKMKKVARKQIRASQRKGVTVKFGDRLDVRTFFDLHNRSAAHQKFAVFPERYFSYLTETFGTERVPTFVAYHAGKPISALMNFVMDNRLYSCWFGMDRDANNNELNATRLLYFEAMKWGRNNGLEGFDLTGTSLLRNQLAHYLIQRPTIQRKHFGPTKGLHRLIVHTCGRFDPLRTFTTKAARRLGYQKPMPH